LGEESSLPDGASAKAGIQKRETRNERREKIFFPMALAILHKVLGLRFWVLGTPMEEEKINSPGLQPWDLGMMKKLLFPWL
jgi:hypothetical protein